MTLSLALVLLSGWVGAVEVPPPPAPAPDVPGQDRPVSLYLNDDALKLKLGKLLSWRGFEFTPSVTGGVVAPFGGGEGTLLPSPFGTAGIQLAHHGALETMTIARAGVVGLDSHTLFDDPGGAAASPANHRPGQTRFHENDFVGSVYQDAGTVLAINSAWKAAVFAAANTWGIQALKDPGNYGGQSMVEGTIGGLVMRKQGADELSVAAALHGEGAGKTMWRNGEYAATPSGELSVEYGRDLGRRTASVGLDATLQRADLGLRPYVKLEQDKVALILAAEARRSRDDFYPNSVGGALGLSYRPTDGVTVGVQGRYRRNDYPMAPAPVNETEIMGNVTIDTGRLFHSEAYKKLKSRKPASTYEPEDSNAMNARLPTAADQFRFKAALTASPTLEGFAKNYGFHSVDDVLGAVSMLTSTLNGDYNNNEGHPQNVAGADNLYAAMRRDYLAGTTDPLTVCIGAAQLAVDLAKASGIPLEAAAMTVQVPGGAGNREGHAVAAIKTKPYGIVFVDWGKLTPTYTWDTKQALNIYQALVGVPSMYHEITSGSDGRHVAYLFTEDGKKVVRAMTALGDLGPTELQRLFDDDPRSGPMTIDRFRELTRGKFR